MRTITVEEAVAGLGKWLELAVGGEDIRIRRGDALIELRPVTGEAGAIPGTTPREVLQRLQAQSLLTPAQAANYLEELRAERLAAE